MFPTLSILARKSFDIRATSAETERYARINKYFYIKFKNNIKKIEFFHKWDF